MKHDIRPRSAAPLLGQRKKRRTMWTFIIFCIAAISMMTTAWYASRSPWFEIATIGVEIDAPLGETSTVLADQVRASAFNIIRETQGHWWQRTSTLFAPYHQLSMRLREQLPILADIRVRPSGLTSIEVQLVPREQAFTICEGEFAYYDEALTPCYAVDTTGVLFRRLAPATTTPEMALRFFVPVDTVFAVASTTNEGSTSPISIGKSIDASLLHRLQDFAHLIAVKGIVAQAVELAVGHADLFAHLSPAIDDSSMITIATAAPFEQQALTLTTFLSSPLIQKRLATSTFEYIDVRYGENVFYKMKTGFASSTAEN
jgi:hypothetical protein